MVPTHNRRGLLAVTLRSVLWQRDVDLEVIVVDDGSSDGTGEYVTGLGDPRVRLVRHDTPQGVAAARNRGIAEATGRWVAFCDDDDLWAPDKLARQLAAAREAGRDWVYTGAVSVGRSLEVVGGVPPLPPEQVAKRLPRYNAVPGGGSNVLVRRGLIDRVGPFETSLYNTEDWEMWIRLAKHGAPAWVPRPLLAYRVHVGNASLNTRAILDGAAFIERRHHTSVDRGVIYRWLAESCLRRGRRVDALRYLAAAGARGQARNVAGDLYATARRRLHRLDGSTSRQPVLRYPDWVAEAQGWLGRLAA